MFYLDKIFHFQAKKGQHRKRLGKQSQALIVDNLISVKEGRSVHVSLNISDSCNPHAGEAHAYYHYHHCQYLTIFTGLPLSIISTP